MSQTDRRGPAPAGRAWFYHSRLPDRGPSAAPAELARVLDRLAALVEADGVGQSIEFRPANAEGRPDPNVAFVVDIAPAPGGWALAYDDDRAGSRAITVNGSPDEDIVELQWAGEWTETEARCFIDAARARDAALALLRTGELPRMVEWA